MRQYTAATEEVKHKLNFFHIDCQWTRNCAVAARGNRGVIGSQMLQFPWSVDIRLTVSRTDGMGAGSWDTTAWHHNPGGAHSFDGWPGLSYLG